MGSQQILGPIQQTERLKMPPSLFMKPAAEFSLCRRYRYSLSREWDSSLPSVCWLMLNPSIAGADADDPTIRRVTSFSVGFGFGGFVVANLFAMIATDPTDLLKAHRTLPEMDVIGVENFTHILRAAKDRRVIVAWGAIHKRLLPQADRVLGILPEGELWCLGLTAGGLPRHPLFVRGDAELRPFATLPTPPR